MGNSSSIIREEENYNKQIQLIVNKEFDSIVNRTNYDNWFHRYSSLLVNSSELLKSRPKFFIRLCLETLIDLGIDYVTLNELMNLQMKKRFSLTQKIKEEIMKYYNNINNICQVA